MRTMPALISAWCASSSSVRWFTACGKPPPTTSRSCFFSFSSFRRFFSICFSRFSCRFSLSVFGTSRIGGTYAPSGKESSGK